LELQLGQEFGGILYFSGFPRDIHPQQLEWDQKLVGCILELLVALAKAYEQKLKTQKFARMDTQGTRTIVAAFCRTREHEEWFDILIEGGKCY